MTDACVSLRYHDTTDDDDGEHSNVEPADPCLDWSKFCEGGSQ